MLGPFGGTLRGSGSVGESTERMTTGMAAVAGEFLSRCRVCQPLRPGM